MPKTVTWDYIDETSYAAETPEAARAVAKDFLAIARDPATIYHDDTSPAALLVAASECFYDALDPIAAFEAAKEAQDADGEAAPDKRVYLLEGLLRTGQDAEATELADQLRAEATPDPLIYAFLGDTYDTAGQNQAGQDWYNLGIQIISGLIDDSDDLERDEVAELLEARELLVLGRQVIREDAGIPSDELDEEALELLEEYDDDEDDQA